MLTNILGFYLLHTCGLLPLYLLYIKREKKFKSFTDNNVEEIDDLFYRPFVILLSLILSCALLEEVMFRWPLAYFVNNTSLLIIATIISSVTFGWIHGGRHYVPIQGVMGLVYASQFILLGCDYSALCAVTITHWLYNLTIYFISCFPKYIRKYGWRATILGPLPSKSEPAPKPETLYLDPDESFDRYVYSIKK